MRERFAAKAAPTIESPYCMPLLRILKHITADARTDFI
jgi:hypothetical protein